MKTIIEPFRIRSVEPIKMTTVEERSSDTAFEMAFLLDALGEFATDRGRAIGHAISRERTNR